VIREHAVLQVRAGMAEEFLAAFAEAGAIIGAMPGFVAMARAVAPVLRAVPHRRRQVDLRDGGVAMQRSPDARR
jgi:hypothetical protein